MNRKQSPNRMSFRILGLGAMACSLLLLAVGCKKQPFIETVKQTPYLALPQNLDHLLSLDVARLREREFVQQIRQNLRQQPGYREEIAKMRERMGIDPLEDIDAMMMGARGGFNTPGNPLAGAVFVARGRFVDPGTKLGKLHELLAEQFLIAPPPFKESAHPVSNYPKYSLEAASQYAENVKFSLNFAFPSEDLMLFSFSPSLLGETLDVIGGQAEGIRKDKNWLAMLQRPNIGAIFWGTGNIAPQMTAMVPSGMPGASVSNAQQYFFDIDVVSRFNSQIGLICKSVESAEQLAGEIRAGLQALQQQMTLYGVFVPETAKLPGKVTVLPQGQTVKLILTLSDQDTSALKLEWRRLSEENKSGALQLLPGATPPAIPGTPPAQP